MVESVRTGSRTDGLAKITRGGGGLLDSFWKLFESEISARLLATECFSKCASPSRYVTAEGLV